MEIVLKATQGLRQEMIVGSVHQGKLSWMFRIPQLMQEMIVGSVHQEKLRWMFSIPQLKEMVVRSIHRWSLSWILNIPKLMMQLKMDIWVLEKIKESFIQRVGAKDWGDAKERFKEFTSEKKLSALFGKKFNPEAASFIDYCSRAAKHNCQTERTEANANAAFIWSKERGNMAAFYTTEMTSLSVEDTSKLPQFDGFALSFITLDGPNCTVTDIVRALRQHNTAMNRYAYTIVCFQPVDCIHRISEELKQMQLTVQVAYCSKSVNSKGAFFDTTVVPFVLAFSGDSASQTESVHFPPEQSDFFQGTLDDVYKSLLLGLSNENNFVLSTMPAIDLPWKAFELKRNSVVATSVSMKSAFEQKMENIN
eukprot:Em0001g2166a